MSPFAPESGGIQYEMSCTCGHTETTKPAHESGAKLRAKLAAREHLLGRKGHQVQIERFSSDTDRIREDD